MGNIRYSVDIKPKLAGINTKLIYVSKSKYEGDWHSAQHSHYFTELFYIVSGKGNFMVEGEIFPVKENELVVVNPNINHTEKSMDESPLEYIVLGIYGVVFNFSKEEHRDKYSVFDFSENKEEVFGYLMSLIKEIEQKKMNYELICQNILDVLLIKIMRNADHVTINKVELSKKISNECNKVKRYLDSKYSDNITLDDLVELTHISKYYLIHVFTEYSGLSPIKYLNHKRITESKNLLENTDHSVADISLSVGFSSQSYFSQVFKKAMGVSPNEYRKEIKKLKI